MKKVLYLIIASLMVMGLVLAGCPSNGNGVEPTTVTIAAIPGVTPPAIGGTPATSVSTTQYTGTVAWSPADATFQAGVEYTATITLEARSGYTFTGVSANFFTVSGATSVSNAANSGVVTATFPPTAEPATVIKVGIAGDFDVPHGVNMRQGALLAIGEIGEFTAGGTKYKFEIVEANTADLTGDTAATRLAVEARVGDADFWIGGFRTEHTHVMQEVICEDNGKIFLGLGAGGVDLTVKVQADFDNYKYFFRLLPINDYFLVTSAFKIVQSAIMTLLLDPALPFESMADINVYILAENAEWAHPAVVMAETALLPALGVNHVGTARPSDTAGVDALLPIAADMAAKDTHVVMTIIAGTMGFNWAVARHQAGLPVISAGINAMAHMTAFGQLGAAAIGEITLDTTARDIQLSATTQPFLNAWFAAYDGAYPLYTGVSAYDSIYLLKAAVQATNGSLDSDAIAAAIPGLDLPAVSGKLAFYPSAEIDLGHIQPGLRALSPTQAYAMYGDHLLAFYGYDTVQEMAANWATHAADWTSPPHLPQDIAYGPAVGNTAVASQWQGTAAAPIKVAVWPRQHLPTGTPVETLKAYGLFDKWGNWNFQFPGTTDLLIPQLFYDEWGI